VIILTAEATQQALKACEEAGADAFLTKPIDAKRLLDTVVELSPEKRFERTKDASAIAQPLPSKMVSGGPIYTVLDESKLDALSRVGSSPEFIPSLVNGFTSDGEQLMRKLHQAVEERDYPLLRDTAHALKGAAAELGGLQLFHVCRDAEAIKPYDMASAKVKKVVDNVSGDYDSTCAALTEYLSRKHNMVR
jgi:two-component system sensor histidine kinase RpfC